MKSVGWALFFCLMIFGQVFVVITLAEKKSRDERLAVLEEQTLKMNNEAAYKKAVKKLFKLKAKIGGYDVFVPETIDEIERQADALSQCLIYCDYVQEVIDKKCVLVFVQKDGVPVATAELLSRNRIGQFYADEADRDDCLPPEDVVNAVKEWIKRKKAA